MKVLYLTNIPSPYRVNYYNELGKSCELTVLFELEESTERDKSWKNYNFQNFTGIIMKGKRINLDTAFCPSVVKYLKKERYDFIIVTNLASPTGILAAAWMKLHHIPYYYEGDGGVSGKNYGIKAELKKFIIGSARLCFSTTKSFDEYCMTYGAPKENIRRYPFTSIFEDDVLDHLPDKEEKISLKSKLKIKEKNIILSVGRMIHLKGYDVLLNAFAEVEDDAWGIYIIGGKATDEFQNIVAAHGLKNVHFMDFILPQELQNYYRAADLFVLPTRYDPWGLVINEAMAKGLPVITTYACGAGTEMVVQHENGYLYDAEDIAGLSKDLVTLMQDENLRQRMGQKGLEIAKKYTIEKMAEAHYRVLEEELDHGHGQRE